MIAAAGNLKPSLWCPGQNPYAHDLWRGCVGYWPLWEGAGATAHDISPHGNNGTLTNMEAADWQSGQRGMMLDFDGSNEFINCGTMPDVDGASAASWLMLINRDDQGATGRDLFSKWTGGSVTFYNEMNAGVGQGSLICGIGASAYGRINSGITKETWYVIQGVFDGTQASNATRLKMYIDGVAQALTFGNTIPTTLGSSGQILGIGGTSLVARYFNGRFALAILWLRALADAEVIALSADPFIMIRPPDFSPFWDVTGAAGGHPTMRRWGGVPHMTPGPILPGRSW